MVKAPFSIFVFIFFLMSFFSVNLHASNSQLFTLRDFYHPNITKSPVCRSLLEVTQGLSTSLSGSDSTSEQSVICQHHHQQPLSLSANELHQIELQISFLISINQPDWINPFENEISSRLKLIKSSLLKNREKQFDQIEIHLAEVLPVLNDFHCTTNMAVLREFFNSKGLRSKANEFIESNCPQQNVVNPIPGILWVMPNLNELKIRTASRLVFLYPQLSDLFSGLVSEITINSEKRKFLEENDLLIPKSLEPYQLKNDDEFIREINLVTSFKNLKETDALRLIQKSFVHNHIVGRTPGPVGCQSNSFQSSQPHSLSPEEVSLANSCLTNSEKQSIDNYFGIGYALINSALRRMDLSEEITAKVNLISSTLQKLTPFHGVIFRGAGESALFENIQPGREQVLDKAFLSTSLDSDIARKFTERNIAPARFIILSKTCRYISHVNGVYGTGENEVLCPPSMLVQVLHKIKIDQVTYIVGEEKSFQN